MPRGVRGSGKKPSITRAKKPQQEDLSDLLGTAPAAPAPDLFTRLEPYLKNFFTVFNVRFEEMVTSLNTLADNAVAPGGVPAEVITSINRLEKLVGVEEVSSIEKRLCDRIAALEKLVTVPATPGEVVEIRKRRTKAEMEAARAAEAAAPAPTAIIQPAKPKSEVIICKHIGTLEDIPGRPTLERCNTCGAVLDKTPAAPVVAITPAPTPAPVAPAAQATVSVPAAPAPAPSPAPATNGKVPSIDDVRAVAITFAGKHGKTKLSDLLKEFGATNLTTLPEESRAAAMAKLQAGI